MALDQAKLHEEWPLVGRSREVKRLTQFLAPGQPRALTLVGGRGVGKTRLARELVKRAERTGWRISWACGTRAMSSVPLGALAHLPLISERERGKPVGTTTLADLADRLAPPDRGQPHLIVVDDADLLDPASQRLIDEIARRRTASVLTVTESAPPGQPSSPDRQGPGAGHHLRVAGLDSHEIHAMLAEVLGGPLDGAVASWLVRRSSGDLLFIRELVVCALERGELRDEGGLWRWHGSPSLPDRLVELVEGRLQSLEDDERKLMELVALAEEISAGALARLAPEATRRRLVDRGLISATPGSDGGEPRLRIANPMYGDVLRSRIPSLRGRELARDLATALEASGPLRSEDVLRIAVWRLDSGGCDAGLLLEAASIARWQSRFELAERLATAAATAGAGFDAELMLARLAKLRGRTAEAGTRLTDLARTVRTDREHALIAIEALDTSVFNTGSCDVTLSGGSAAEQPSDVSPNPADEIQARLSGVVLATEGYGPARVHALSVLGADPSRSSPRACQIACLGLSRQGSFGEALRMVGHAESAARHLDAALEWYPWMHIWLRSEVLTDAGDLIGARQIIDGEYTRSLAGGSPEARAYFAWQSGRAILDAGRLDQTLVRLQEAAALFDELGRAGFARSALTMLAMARAVGGRSAEATEALDSARLIDAGAARWMDAEEALAEAWVTSAAGDLLLAHQHLHRAAESAQTSGDLVTAASALHSLARMGRPDAALSPLRRLAQTMEGPLIGARVSHVAALCASDPGALRAVSDVFESLGADLLAAEAAADAAVSARQDGRKDAASWEKRATSLAMRGGETVTPALLPVGVRAMLTAAENKAALLAAGGRSNKEIAEALGISVRTAENRLQQVYTKLGISSRSALRSAFPTERSG